MTSCLDDVEARLAVSSFDLQCDHLSFVYATFALCYFALRCSRILNSTALHDQRIGQPLRKELITIWT